MAAGAIVQVTAQSLLPYGVELEDAYGAKGLVEAASRFDLTRGVPFV
jgi:DNA-directed RNA polymerase sigma subunit (sigma70/sigma32)